MIKAKITNKIGDKVTEYKNITGTRKNKVAQRLGITKQALDKVAKGKNPTIGTLESVARVLGCDIKDLYDVEIEETEE